KSAALGLKPLDSFQCPAITLRLGFAEILGEELEVQPQRAQVVLNLMDEAAGKFGEFHVLVIQHSFRDLKCKNPRVATRGLEPTAYPPPGPSLRRRGGPPSCLGGPPSG